MLNKSIYGNCHQEEIMPLTVFLREDVKARAYVIALLTHQGIVGSDPKQLKVSSVFNWRTGILSEVKMVFAKVRDHRIAQIQTPLVKGYEISVEIVQSIEDISRSVDDHNLPFHNRQIIDSQGKMHQVEVETAYGGDIAVDSISGNVFSSKGIDITLRSKNLSAILQVYKEVVPMSAQQ